MGVLVEEMVVVVVGTEMQVVVTALGGLVKVFSLGIIIVELGQRVAEVVRVGMVLVAVMVGVVGMEVEGEVVMRDGLVHMVSSFFSELLFSFCDFCCHLCGQGLAPEGTSET